MKAKRRRRRRGPEPTSLELGKRFLSIPTVPFPFGSLPFLSLFSLSLSLLFFMGFLLSYRDYALYYTCLSPPSVAAAAVRTTEEIFLPLSLSLSPPLPPHYISTTLLQIFTQRRIQGDQKRTFVEAREFSTLLVMIAFLLFRVFSSSSFFPPCDGG